LGYVQAKPSALVIWVADFHAVSFPESHDCVIFDADNDLAISPSDNFAVMSDISRRFWHPVVPDYLAL
jgi:hypothetical protein